MKAIEINGVISIFSNIPNEWAGTIGYNYAGAEQHKADGWRDMETPIFDPATHKLGSLYFNEAEDVFTYHVIELSAEEPQQRALEQVESDREIKIQAILKEQILNSAHDMSDEDALVNQELFPVWESDMWVQSDKCVLAFDNNNELVLWKVVQAHLTQAGWKPKDTPALFVRVALPDEVLEWVQPTGAHDAYRIGDLVMYNGVKYICTYDYNTYAPSVYGWEVAQ